MKNRLSLLAGFLLLFALPVTLGAGTDGEAQYMGWLLIGGWDASTDGAPDVVSEYEPNEGGVDLGVGVVSRRDNGETLLKARLRDSDDYDLRFKFDVGRSVRSKTALTALIHRLQHEDLEHFDTATNHGRLAWHTDHNPADVYGIDYRLLEHRTEFQPRATGKLTLHVGYRQQEREGTVQSTTISHCDSCHVVSQSRPIDEETTDVSFGGKVAWQGGQIGFSANSREFSTDPTAISLLYDDALHPELRLPLFDNRLQFDSAEGPQAVDRRSDTSKDTYRIDGTFNDVGGFTVAAQGVWSATENDYSQRESEYSGYLLSAARRFDNQWNLRWRGARLHHRYRRLLRRCGRTVGRSRSAGGEDVSGDLRFHPRLPRSFSGQS